MLTNRCPVCGSSKIRCARELGCFFVIFLLVSMGIGLVMYPFLPKTCTCRSCGATWKP